LVVTIADAGRRHRIGRQQYARVFDAACRQEEMAEPYVDLPAAGRPDVKPLNDAASAARTSSRTVA
jgi:hypothetical protein